jgi:glycosyltransferase involved in cell wall biosynthesis
MHLVIIIPCLNEEKSIGDVISRIPGTMDGISKTTVVVIDDGSTDATAGIAKDQGAMVVSHPFNMGVGAAFQTGISQALSLRADVIVNLDGDGQFNPEDIPALIHPILTGTADFATASRFKDPELVPEMTRVKKWGNRRIAELISLLIGIRFYDVSCGFRAYTKETALRLNLFGRFTYTHETFLDLAFKDFRMAEIPLKIRGIREHGRSRVASNLFKYAFNSSKIIFRTFRDYKPLVFFSVISVFQFSMAATLAVFFIAHYLATGTFSPHLWAGLTSGFFLMLSVLFFVTGLLADMLSRIRDNQEKMLYYDKKRFYYGDDVRLQDQEMKK